MASTAPNGTFTVLYFASASSFTGKDVDSFPAPVALADLFSLLESRYPGIRAWAQKYCMLTVNLDYIDVPKDGSADSGLVLKAGDELALIPPVSSG